jgi:hypothetical protein
MGSGTAKAKEESRLEAGKSSVVFADENGSLKYTPWSLSILLHTHTPTILAFLKSVYFHSWRVQKLDPLHMSQVGSGAGMDNYINPYTKY